MEVYADNLMRALIGSNSKNKIRIYRPATRFSNNNEVGLWQMRVARYLEYPAQIKRFKADLYHITEHGYSHLIKSLPANRTVVTVHDLIPFLKHRGAIKGVTPGKNPRLAEYSLKHLKHAAHLIAVSKNTKRDLIEHCGCNSEQITVVYQGLDILTQHQSLTKSEARSQLNLPNGSEKLVLITGQDFYKNLATSVRIYNRLKKNHSICLIHLGLSNRIWLKAKNLADNPESIIELSQIPRKEVAKLYKAVDCVLFPSWYEGFGLPPVEAMACGTPAVTSNVASLPEAVGSDTLTASPDDIDGLTTAVQTVLYDESKKSEIIQKGLVHSQNFTWDNCARQTLSVYEKVLNQLS